MPWPCVYNQIDFETLYCTYRESIVRFCATCLVTCPDGTAEEVAQDVFIAAHRALLEQRYRGEGPLSAWLFGIARNLCSKARRDIARKTASPSRPCATMYGDPPAPPGGVDHTQEVCTVMHASFQRLARQDQQAYALLHMHVLKGASIRELAEWQGMSRSTVQRRLAQAKTTLSTLFHACADEETC